MKIAWFMTPLNLQDIDGKHFELLSPLVYSSATGRIFTVPAGFVTDFASIPRGLWNLLPVHGRQDKAAVLHDFLYAHNGVTRAEADALFREAMEAEGVGKVARNLMYAGVRAGGWKPWNKYRAADQKKESSDE